MNYTALYRKYRPVRFDEVRGQDPIVRTLKNQIEFGRIGHAYLFTGTRGTGKTTLAKIFARAVNCEHPVDQSPCNECPTCRAILNGTSTNVVEIDAASNNGVDTVRELREEVKYRPTEGRYRVYIIDEVHMLSPGAFNALLKTLEEPPEYVIFLLATTDVQRIPPTVRSRCQRYDLKRLTLEELESQLRSILEAEQIPAEDNAIRYLAMQADGSSRDALSLLERCASFHKGEVLTYEEALDILGAVDHRVYSEMLASIREGRMEKAVHVIDEILFSGREVAQFVTDFVWYLRNLLLIQAENPGEALLGVSRENLERMQKEAAALSLDETTRYIRIFSELLNDLRYAPNKRVLLELAVIRAMQPAMETDTESLRNRIRKLEEEVEKLSSGAVTFEKPAEPKKEAPAKTEKQITVSAAVFADYDRIRREWDDIAGDYVGLSKSILQEVKVSVSESEGIVLLCPDEFRRNALEKNGLKEKLEAQFEKRYGKKFRLTVKGLKQNEKPPVVVLGNRIEGIEMEIQGGN